MSDAPHSTAGKPRHVVPTDEGQRLFGTLMTENIADDQIFTPRGCGHSYVEAAAPTR